MLEAYEGTGTYDHTHRLALMSHLEDPEQRKHPWPAELDAAFGVETQHGHASPVPNSVQRPPTSDTKPASSDSSTCKNVGTRSGAEGGSGVSGVSGGGSGCSGRGEKLVPPPLSATVAAQRNSRGRASRGAKTEGPVLLGSPMVDATLEDTQGLRAVMEALKREMGLDTGDKREEGADGGEGRRGGGVVVKMEVKGVALRVE